MKWRHNILEQQFESERFLIKRRKNCGYNLFLKQGELLLRIGFTGRLRIAKEQCVEYAKNEDRLVAINHLLTLDWISYAFRKQLEKEKKRLISALKHRKPTRPFSNIYPKFLASKKYAGFHYAAGPTSPSAWP